MELPAFLIAILVFGIIVIFKGVKIVPQQQVWVAERLGRFHALLQPGLNIIVPFFDRVAYKHSLKEEAIDIKSQAAITRDNVTLTLDGVIFVKIIDPKLASYGVADPYFAVTQLAQTTMRSEIGKMDLDKTFEEREKLNVNIVNALNEASESWGIQCMRYEIKDIEPPKSILIAMEQQVTADRTKRALILESEGKKQFQINLAEAEKQQVVLQSEASKIDQINRAQGEAEAILAVAHATAESIEKVAIAIQKQGGTDAVSLRIAEQYVQAFSKLAKQGNTIIVPANAADAGSMVAQALSVFDGIRNKKVGSASPWENKQ
jgi:regulator of protease activity HflC (stomatin/prohibitin superfamily)